MRRLSVALLLVAAAACGSSSPPVAPSPVTQTPVTPPPPPPPVILTGRVVAAVTGEALGGLSVLLADKTTTTDADGRFRYELPPGTVATPRLTVSGSGIVSHSLSLSIQGSRDVSLDAIPLSGGFDLDYYRQLVRDAYDSPGLLRPLRRWTRAPHVYLKTVDEAGNPIEADTLEPVAAALVDDAAAWTGGRFGIAGVERGTETREGVSGWITVKWPVEFDPDVCGRAQIAADGGWIELDYLNRDCACKSSRIAPGIVRHELGHAMGFYHTSQRDDALYPFAQCDRHPSARERLHAAIAYGRPWGNTDPDDDPFSLFQRYQPSAPIVIVN
jgi:hypothetical protein